MLYLVYVLTFLAGILFYALSPRDNQVSLDSYKAEGFIASFLAQHQAAKDYVSQWLGFDLDAGASITFIRLDKNKLISFLPQSVTYDISDRQSDPTKPITMDASDSDFLTTVFCLDDSDTLQNCDSNPSPKNIYLTTYSLDRPSWWPSEASNRARRYGAWRTALARRTRGSYSCGVLTCKDYIANGYKCVGDKWCIDNGKGATFPNGTCQQKVPRTILEELGCFTGGPDSDECYDSFFCISRVKQGASKYYASGLTAFYDAINNKAKGAEGGRGGSQWSDMVRNEKTTYAKFDDPEIWSQLISGQVSADGYHNDVRTMLQSLGGECWNSGAATADAPSGQNLIFPIQLADANGPFHPFTLTLLLSRNTRDGTDDDGATVVNLNGLRLFLNALDDGNYRIRWQSCDGSKTGWGNTYIPVYSTTGEVNKFSLTLIGSSEDVKAYVNAGSDPVLTFTKSSSNCNSDAYRPMKCMLLTMNDTSAGDTRLYSVRYYEGKQLKVRGKRKNNHQLIPSDLEQNFNLDSKRYGIGSPLDNLRPEYDS